VSTRPCTGKSLADKNPAASRVIFGFTGHSVNERRFESLERLLIGPLSANVRILIRIGDRAACDAGSTSHKSVEFRGNLSPVVLQFLHDPFVQPDIHLGRTIHVTVVAQLPSQLLAVGQAAV
jgi:hypothetical protein